MSHGRSIFVSLCLLFALAVGLPERAFGQSGAKQSSKKAKPATKSHTDKAKQQPTLTDMQKEQARLSAEAEAYEKKFKKSKEQESATLANINRLEQQTNVKRKTIKKLQEQEKLLTGEIQDARVSIGDLEKQLESLKSHYARYIRSVYKYGRVYDVELLFSSKSINQLYIRVEYLKRFSEQRAKDLQNVVHKKNDLEHQNERLESNLQRQQRVLAERTAEESSLKDDVSRRQKMLVSIKKDTKFYREQWDEKTKAAEKLNNIIADLIEKEAERKERETAAARDRERVTGVPKSTAPPEPITGTFASNRGRLPWPVHPIGIASRFGNHVHPVLKTVRQNTGIDINVQSGSNVLAVADGEVSILTFIPGFGNIAILNHYNGYRTIYAHLSEISVVEGQKVKAGETIARSGDSVEGSILHFEIWLDRENQNPELWLAKR